MSRALLIQLARLGDLVQSLPVLTALHSANPEQALDLLCPSPLVALGELFPCVERVFPWKGEQWHALATKRMTDCDQLLVQAKQNLSECDFPRYSLAYNLNNHPRGILAGHVLSDRVVGPGELGPLSPALPAWAGYLRQVAQDRGSNRVHLADAFCGLCQVLPPSDIPFVKSPMVALPLELERLVHGQSSTVIGIVLGAGDADRRIPLSVWQDLVASCAELIPESYLLLIGGTGEREAALALENRLPAKYLNRVVNGCGKTSLPQLVSILNRCQWVVGSDTGPLHLGAMCGARAIGWYFSRARVHETGPYGIGHYVWQRQGDQTRESPDGHRANTAGSSFAHWPIMETVHLMREEQVDSTTNEWDLWTSHRDEWGAFYTRDDEPEEAVLRRKDTWEKLSQLANQDFKVGVSR
jgi:ADP-heptose:LPS heptosyltransferase